MTLENAKANLEEFGKELNLEGLAFDENHTCILGIDNVFSLHLTYEPNSNRLYLYSPILDGLPKDEKILLKLYQHFLEGSMLGGQMVGGGLGVAPKEELVLMHATLEMAAADSSALRRFAPMFVEAVEKWRAVAQDVMAGNEPNLALPTSGGPGGAVAPQQPKKGDDNDPKGDRFIKI